MCWWRLSAPANTRPPSSIVKNRPCCPLEHNQLAGIERYTASAERGGTRALTQLRAAQNDRRKCERRCPAPAPVPQPEETEKVMTVGSVLQIEPEPAETPESAPAPAIAALPELENAPAADEDARPDAQNGKFRPPTGAPTTSWLLRKTILRACVIASNSACRDRPTPASACCQRRRTRHRRRLPRGGGGAPAVNWDSVPEPDPLVSPEPFVC